MPDLRARLHDYLGTEDAHFVAEGLLSIGRGSFNPVRSSPGLAAQLLLDDERTRLRNGQMFHVSADMTTLARRSGAKLPEWGVRAEDLPAPAGFMVFAEPIGSYPKGDPVTGAPVTIPIVAVSWGPTGLTPNDDLWMTFWSVTDFEMQAGIIRAVTGMPREQALRKAYAVLGELSWDNEVVIPLELPAEEIGEVSPTFGGLGTNVVTSLSAQWTRSVRATFLLMQQDGMGEVGQAALPARTARKATAAGLNTSPVRVVNIHPSRRRRRDGAGRPAAAPTGTGRKLMVHQKVREHWKSHYFPSLGRTKRILIEEYGRGPEDAPTTSADPRPVVRVLDRLPSAAGDGVDSGG